MDDLQSSKKKAGSGKNKDNAETTLLWRCCIEEDVDGAEELLAAKGGEVNMRDSCFGWTALHMAASSGIERLTKLLLDAKAKAEITCHEHNTPLIIASRNGSLGVVKYLLSKKADMDTGNTNGWTPLIWSSMAGHDAVTNVLLEAGADYKRTDGQARTACMWAARHGHLTIVESLLACGLNLSQQDDAGMTVMDHAQEHMELRTMIRAVEEVNHCMLEAAKINDYEGVRRCIEAGAYLDFRDEDGWTTLMYAALHQSLDMVQLVVRHGANPSLLDEDGELVAELGSQHLAVGDALYNVLGSNERMLDAAEDAKWDDVDHELNVGAWVNVRDEDKRTALMHAARHGSAAACGNLCSKGAATDERDIFGWMASHFAVASRSAETVSMLYYHGADFSTPTYQGDTVLHLAALMNDGCIMQLLIVGKADLEAINVEKITALQLAAREGLAEACSTLLAYGADVNTKTKKLGRTPFHMAVMGGHLAAIDVFMEPLEPPPKIRGLEEEDSEKKAAEAKAKAKAKESEKSKEKEKEKEKTKEPATKGTAKSKAKAKGKAGGGASKAPGGSAHSASAERPSSAAMRAAAGVAGKKAAAPKKESQKIGADPMALIVNTAKKREAIAKSAKNPLGAKAAMKQADNDGRMPLALAIRKKQEDVIEMLMREKADIEATDAKANTILMEAVMAKNRDLVDSLLEMKAKFDRSNADKKTAIDMCKDPRIMVLLQARRMATCLSDIESKAAPKKGKEVKGKESGKASPKVTKTPKKEKPQEPTWRVRLEALPTHLTGELLEDHLRALMRKMGAPPPSRVQVALDPITFRPRGHAYMDFLDAAAAELAVRGHGQELLGHVVTACQEKAPKLLPPLVQPAEANESLA
eukprot:TRINITY_DN1340_c0_g1_i1.p1 TRINITY_DN1340_c0_g1~~TRINITY_DN1340_c0_g1_i1.p1  ORF type:complete len:870 (+),score=209.16 TRINITY_DN1340_c0_g1_i1:67-2676(+)